MSAENNDNLIDERKVICMRKPPWTCPKCRDETVDTFVWKEEYQTFEATCSTCGTQVYS